MQRQLSPATRWHLRSKLDDLLRKESASRNSRAVGCARHELALRVRALHRGALYATIPLAFAIHNAHANALPAAFLLASFLANGSSFLAFSIMAERRRLTTTRQGFKSIYYLAGIAEGSMQLFSSRPFAYGRNGFRISQSRSRRCVSSPRQLAWFLDGKCFLISP